MQLTCISVVHVKKTLENKGIERLTSIFRGVILLIDKYAIKGIFYILEGNMKKIICSIICLTVILSSLCLVTVKAIDDTNEIQNFIQTSNSIDENNIYQMNELETENKDLQDTKTDNNSNANNIRELESNKYIIDNENNVIYRVIPETDVETFKNNFSIPEDIKVFEDEKCETEVVNKYIGTGMVLRNETDNEIYKISVIGDFNTDGKITQIELTNLIRHVVGLKEYQLSSYVLKSADINNDNIVNHIDITLLIRYNVYGELDIEENKEKLLHLYWYFC